LLDSHTAGIPVDSIKKPRSFAGFLFFPIDRIAALILRRSAYTGSEVSGGCAMRETRPTRRAWRYVAAFGLLIVLAAAAAIYQAWLRQPAVHDFDVSDTALVVLPLHTGSQHDDAVLAQGFSAELIERLAIIKDLRVIGNASAQRAVSENFDSSAPRTASRARCAYRQRRHMSNCA